MPHHTEPHEETPESVRRQRELGDDVGRRLFCAFHGKDWVRQGRQV